MGNEKEINDLREILSSIAIDISLNIKYGYDNTFNYESYEYYSKWLEGLWTGENKGAQRSQ